MDLNGGLNCFSRNCPLNLSAVVARNVQLDFKSVNLEDLVCDRDSQPGALGNGISLSHM